MKNKEILKLYTLEKETDIKLFKIALSDVPQGITTYQMHDIMDLVEE